jgi:hypothetical protein
MEQSDKITQIREDARDTQVANKIMDSIRALRLGSSEESSRRWVWELIQNAKDVGNDLQGVDIRINLALDKKTLRFEHNGSLFTMQNLIFLIEQVSTKEREVETEGSRKTTGKFGTGFLTTNLLSEHVTVSGYMKDDDGEVQAFSVDIDRSGKNKNEIIAANQKSFEQLRESLNGSNEEVILDDKAYNTSFLYELDEQGIEVARKGIHDLHLSLPYVFAFVPEINTVNIQSNNYIFSRGEEHDFDTYKVQEINVAEDEMSSVRYIGKMHDDDVAVAVELKRDQGHVSFVEFPTKIPKVFCDFPLIGTEDFCFPVIVNSSRFNPTEPRDGIFIKDIKNDESDENKELLIKALNLYFTLLTRSSNNDYQRHYNAVKLCKPKDKPWLSIPWLNENIVSKLIRGIKRIPIVDTVDDGKKELVDEAGNPQIWILQSVSKEKREKLWYLLRGIARECLPKQEEIHEWTKALGSLINSFEIDNLLERVEQYATVEELELVLQYEGGTITWLNDFYTLLMEDGSLQSAISQGRTIFPNQQGLFCDMKSLSRDMGIDEEYKDILDLSGQDIKARLLLKGIDPESLISFPEYHYDGVFEEIKSLLEDVFNEEEIYRELLVLYESETQLTEEWQTLIDYANEILDFNFQRMKKVGKISQDLLKDAMKYICTTIADQVSEFGSISKLEDEKDMLTGTGEAWITKFIEFIQKMKYSNLLEKKTKPILPNQKGIFKPKEELYLEAEGLDEVLKDIAGMSGYDIREELLVQEIYLELPQNREKSIKDITVVITEFIRKNQGCLEEKIRDAFRKLYLWINENSDIAQESFKDIYDNKHWLYDDHEIAQNMRKAEDVDSMLRRHKISDLESLERILSNTTGESNQIEEIEITEEMLVESGITSEEKLNQAMELEHFAAHFIHETESNVERFQYVKDILQRSKANILAHLATKEEYDLDSVTDVDDTISIIEKNGEELYLIMRPSDYRQVIIYYDTEKDIMDYEKDWELWVEDGKNQPQKITFGKMLKLTGINKIPMRPIV